MTLIKSCGREPIKVLCLGRERRRSRAEIFIRVSPAQLIRNRVPACLYYTRASTAVLVKMERKKRTRSRVNAAAQRTAMEIGVLRPSPVKEIP